MRVWSGRFLIAGTALMLVLTGSIALTEMTSPDWSDLALPAKVVFIWGLPGPIVIWCWMIVHFLRAREQNYRRLWGVSLIVFNWAAAFAYFLFVYSPRAGSACVTTHDSGI